MDALPIPTALLNGVGVLTLLGWLFWMLSTGRLVTRREHENRIADKDNVIADKVQQVTAWRATAETKDAQLNESLEQNRLGVQLMQALVEKARGGDQE